MIATMVTSRRRAVGCDASYCRMTPIEKGCHSKEEGAVFKVQEFSPRVAPLLCNSRHTQLLAASKSAWVCSSEKGLSLEDPREVEHALNYVILTAQRGRSSSPEIYGWCSSFPISREIVCICTNKAAIRVSWWSYI